MRNRIHELVTHADSNLTVDIVIEPSLSGKSLELLQRVGLDSRHLLLVCDENTYPALAERITHELGKTSITVARFPGIEADEAAVNQLRASKADGYIAVGSGTINDVCKYASFLEEKPYVVFPTAPSMNGYISANASITLRGHKKSLPAHLPAGVFCDLGVLSAAPMRLIRSGLGDSVCRSTAQADWLLSHLLLGTAYNPLPFSLLEPYEDDLLAAAGALNQRKHYAIELLTRTLLISGMGMVIAGGSYPASQGEHMLAHTMEMKHGDSLPPSYHGEQIGVATLLINELQHTLLAKPVRLRRHSDWLTTATRYFGESQREELAEAAEKKFRLVDSRIEEINDLLATERNYLRDTIGHVLKPAETIRQALELAGAPTRPEEIGWEQLQVEDALHHACYMRDRFTFLDLV